MTTPRPIREALEDLERRYSGPIPKDARYECQFPQDGRRYSPSETAEIVAFFNWQCQSRWKQVKNSAYWARQSKRGTDMWRRRHDRERFQIAVRCLRNEWRLRAAWVNHERRLGQVRDAAE